MAGRCCATFARPSQETFFDFRAEGGLKHKALKWEPSGGQGRLVVCLHAASLCAGAWAPVAGRLKSTTVVACDLRGHGDTDAPSDPSQYSWQLFGQDFLRIIREVTKQYGREPDACITHSFAGDTALLALAEGAKPVGRMILLDPVLADAEGASSGAARLAKGTRRLGEKEAEGFDSAEAVAKGLEKVLRGALARDALHPEAKAAFAAYGSKPGGDGRWRLKCRRENEAEVYANRVALADYLSERFVDASVQLVFAGRRRGRPEDLEAQRPRDRHEAQRVVDRCGSGSKVHEVEGVGHFLLLEDPDLVAETLEKLLA
eukprot:TRINITY_DN36390_c0_g1_i1.p1 TRINITY_DN36390_c0_g1~~TRINITY_DN36390_c0_g1_i1.p1  ORF type:complete len:339 (-),score=75.62 TRINITY_DN36390_c0_g1_i1:65-1015(-)